MSGLFHRILAHPLTKGMALDEPRKMPLRREITQTKTFSEQNLPRAVRLPGGQHAA
jgi:hypothetical protein